MSGGVAVLLAMAAAAGLVGGTAIFTGLVAYWAGVAVIFGMGLIDDWMVLRPGAKLAGQLLSISVFLAIMVTTSQLSAGPWLLLVGFWLLAITNSLNLLDNMDGLAAGVGAIAALALACWF